MAWDITVPATYANSFIADTATIASTAAKYQELAKTHQSAPMAIETGGAWNEKAVEFTSEVGRRITELINEQQETMFLFQRISVALKRGNAIAFRNTFPSEQQFLNQRRPFRK